MEPSLSDLLPEDLADLAQRPAWVDEAVAQRYPQGRLDGGPEDLALLERLVGEGELTAEQEFEWGCICVAFGRVLIRQHRALSWCVLHDYDRAEPALRHRDAPLVIPLSEVHAQLCSGASPRLYFEQLSRVIRSTGP